MIAMPEYSKNDVLKKEFHFNPYAALAFGALLGYVLAYLNHLTPHGALPFVFSLVAVGLVALALRAFRGTGVGKKTNDELSYLRYRKRLYEQNRLFAKVCDEAGREGPVCN